MSATRSGSCIELPTLDCARCGVRYQGLDMQGVKDREDRFICVSCLVEVALAVPKVESMKPTNTERVCERCHGPINAEGGCGCDWPI